MKPHAEAKKEAPNLWAGEGQGTAVPGGTVSYLDSTPLHATCQTGHTHTLGQFPAHEHRRLAQLTTNEAQRARHLTHAEDVTDWAAIAEEAQRAAIARIAGNADLVEKTRAAVEKYVGIANPPAKPSAPTKPPQVTAPNDPYASAAFVGEIDLLGRAPMGDRNNALFRAARRLAEFVAAGRLVELEVKAALEDTARALGLVGGEVEATIKSGFNPAKVAPCYDGLPEPGQARPEPKHRPEPGQGWSPSWAISEGPRDVVDQINAVGQQEKCGALVTYTTGDLAFGKFRMYCNKVKTCPACRRRKAREVAQRLQGVVGLQLVKVTRDQQKKIARKHGQDRYFKIATADDQVALLTDLPDLDGDLIPWDALTDDTEWLEKLIEHQPQNRRMSGKLGHVEKPEPDGAPVETTAVITWHTTTAEELEAIHHDAHLDVWADLVDPLTVEDVTANMELVTRRYIAKLEALGFSFVETTVTRYIDAIGPGEDIATMSHPGLTWAPITTAQGLPDPP